jgi:20S proteasome subunit beta 2
MDMLLLPLFILLSYVNIAAASSDLPFVTADTSAFSPRTDSLTRTITTSGSGRAKIDILPALEEDGAMDDLWMDEWKDDLIEGDTGVAGPSSSFPTTRLALHLDSPSSTTTQKIQQPIPKKHLKKTGTTIAGCIFNGTVILAADTRATAETMVADKKCLKLHPLARNVWCAGAGTSADLDHLTKECMYSMALQHSIQASIGNEHSSTQQDQQFLEPEQWVAIGSSVSIEQVCSFLQGSLWDAGGQLGANLILGGVSSGKAYLRALHPHGSMDIELPFAALGSGGLAAIGVLEEGYSKIGSLQDATQLCQRAILAGIKNDLGSGSQVDMVVISPDGTSQLERCSIPEESLEDDELSKELAASPSSSLGVNGFGNLPFGIQSQKVRAVSMEDNQQQRVKEWNNLLGLSNT